MLLISSLKHLYLYTFRVEIEKSLRVIPILPPFDKQNPSLSIPVPHVEASCVKRQENEEHVMLVFHIRTLSWNKT